MDLTQISSNNIPNIHLKLKMLMKNQKKTAKNHLKRILTKKMMILIRLSNSMVALSVICKAIPNKKKRVLWIQKKDLLSIHQKRHKRYH